MKSKKNELDVDFIGGEKPLTKEEERALSDYFKAQKLKRNKSAITRRGASARSSKAATL